MKWTLESFRPSDGTMHANVPEDHLAWLNKSGEEPIFMKVQFSSRGVSTEDAKSILGAMLRGLNS